MPFSPIEDHGLAIEDHERRIGWLEGRVKSVADAELAYRQAEASIKQLRSEHADEHRSMLDSAKEILNVAAAKAIEPLRPALATVDEIREAQKIRHGVDLALQQAAAARSASLAKTLKVIAALTGAAVTITEFLRNIAPLLKGVHP